MLKFELEAALAWVWTPNYQQNKTKAKSMWVTSEPGLLRQSLWFCSFFTIFIEQTRLDTTREFKQQNF